ncbi:Retrovirus-related Pol polyprotein from transposon 297 [Araneus ventricosus]|uniref:Retrovirus-related Pol polyprotein from transposon 297 n=1 Tax=Araneus ventricosus TaxID=182803 RepID=A0A4Y2M114_ARAVE|nr:Retrovirus-related Pol polyprotein from transposon 297 [Araneus ventricosus]
MESQFTLAGVTSEITKFHHIVAAVQPEELEVVGDIMLNPPADEPCDALRKRLCSQYADSEEQRLRYLISGMQLGDRKPSRLLLEMRSKAENKISEELLKSLFLQRLPTHVQQILAISNDKLDRLAETADCIMAAATDSVASSAVTSEEVNLQATLMEISSRLSRLEALGKLVRPSLGPSGDGATEIHSLYLSDKSTASKFLIDTGADIPVIPPSTSKQHCQKSELQLFAANGTEIPTFGQLLLKLDLGLRRAFHWPFVIAKVSQPIIGADFLRHFGLLVDIRQGCLIDPLTKLQSRGTVQCGKGSDIKTISGDTEFHRLLSEFPSLTEASSTRQAKHDIKHCIQTTGPPVFSRPRRLPPDKLKAAKQEFEFLVATGVCRPSKSCWASPLHMVTKSNGDWSPCGDYRKLNSVTVPDHSPVPHIQDCLQVLEGKKIFSTLDLAKAYHLIPVLEEDVPKTAVATPFGLFEFLHMPFGLSNTAATFQRFIHHVLSGMDFCVPYFDDVLVASEREIQHLEHLKQVFQRFEEYGVRLNASKCVLGKLSVKFLGHIVTPYGITPLPEKVSPITDFPEPRAKKNDKTPITWTNEAKNAFEKCKHDLAEATVLYHPSVNATLAIVVDASDNAVGAALQQQVTTDWQPLAFYSKSLSPAQRRYSAYDRELLAAYMAIKYFRHMIEGRSFILFTDH